MIATEYDIYDTGTNHYDGSTYICLTANCPISAGDFTYDVNAGRVNPPSYIVTSLIVVVCANRLYFSDFHLPNPPKTP
jgi:hypothetical protein